MKGERGVPPGPPRVSHGAQGYLKIKNVGPLGAREANFFHFLKQFFAYKSALGAVFWCFETLETCPVLGGFGWFSPGVEWPSRMPVHARFTS